MLFEEFTKKALLGRGEEAVAYTSVVYPDRVIKSYNHVQESREKLEEMRDVASKHPEIFGKYYKIDVERGIVVQEKFTMISQQDADKYVKFLNLREISDYANKGFKDEDMDDIFLKHDAFNMYCSSSFVESDTKVVEHQLESCTEDVQKFVKRCKHVCDEAMKLIDKGWIDFGFQNIGFDKTGTLMLLDY